MSNSRIRPLKETGEHSYHRRAFGHNYYAPFIYHIIIKKVPDCEVFGQVIGDARITPGNPGAATICETTLGQTIAKAIMHLPFEHRILKVHQFCVMPDHVHVLLQVLFQSERHLDFYIDALKHRVTTKYSERTNRTVIEDDIFEPGYCDKPLYDNRSLDGLFQYIRENPHRLAMRRQFPEFFSRVRNLTIAGHDYEAYGNLFLFRNPDKEAVKISSKFTAEEKSEKIENWLSKAARGTVLVSPFISKEERDVRDRAKALGAKFILITHEAFSERFKPSGHDFELCEQGRLLIISLGMPANTPLSRQHCVSMNALATTLAEH